jgi:hypothetical protein
MQALLASCEAMLARIRRAAAEAEEAGPATQNSPANARGGS